MTANSLDGDFTTVDTAMLNRYFREYYQAHGQGGTHTQQRNLIQLFNYLAARIRPPHPLHGRTQPLRRSQGTT